MSPRYDRHDTTATLSWMREGTARLLGIVGKLGDEAFAESSALPGWTRGHVVGHLAPAQVRSALGRAIPAAEVPWMRIREVWLHAVDLDAGATLDDLPDGVVDLLLDDVTAALSTKDGCPAVELVASDREAAWRLGEPPSTATVTATAVDLAGWLTGRVSGGSRPALPRWI